MTISADELKNRFFYHAPTEDKARRHKLVNEHLFEVAQELVKIVPSGRQQACMLTALEEAKMWGNAGIAQCAEIYTPRPARELPKVGTLWKQKSTGRIWKVDSVSIAKSEVVLLLFPTKDRVYYSFGELHETFEPQAEVERYGWGV